MNYTISRKNWLKILETLPPEPHKNVGPRMVFIIPEDSVIDPLLTLNPDMLVPVKFITVEFDYDYRIQDWIFKLDNYHPV